MVKKDTYYFSHDFHARTDKNIIKLRMKMGMEGIGLYWCMVEMLHEEGGYLLRTECERIAFELQTDSERITQLIENFDLFKFDDNRFWSNSALGRIDERKAKSESARKSQSYRTYNANDMRTHNERYAKKGKERKGNSKNIESNSLTNDNENQKNNENGTKEYKNFKSQGEDLFHSRISRSHKTD